MREPYVKEMDKIAADSIQLLREGFACKEDEIKEFFRTLD